MWLKTVVEGNSISETLNFKISPESIPLHLFNPTTKPIFHRFSLCTYYLSRGGGYIQYICSYTRSTVPNKYLVKTVNVVVYHEVIMHAITFQSFVYKWLYTKY